MVSCAVFRSDREETPVAWYERVGLLIIGIILLLWFLTMIGAIS